MEEIKELRQILNGIDKDECAFEEGWWETSHGAKFGAKKLKEVENLIKRIMNSQNNKC